MGKWIKVTSEEGEISFIRTDEVRAISEDDDTFVISLKHDGHTIYATHIGIAGEDDVFEWVMKKNAAIIVTQGEE